MSNPDNLISPVLHWCWLLCALRCLVELIQTSHRLQFERHKSPTNTTDEKSLWHDLFWIQNLVWHKEHSPGSCLAATLLSCIQQSSGDVASYHISYVVELGLSRILSAIKSPSEQAGDIQLEISYLKFFEVLTSMQGSGPCYWSGGKNWQNSHLYLLNCRICVSKDWLSFSNRSLGSTQTILFFLCSSFLTPFKKK